MEKTDKTVDKQNKPWLFKEGQSGNPAGRPKGTYSLVTILKRKLQEIIKDKGIEAGEELVKIWLEKAINKKEFDAIKEVIRYIDGMPPQTLQLTKDETIEKIKVEINGSEPKGDKNISKES